MVKPKDQALARAYTQQAYQYYRRDDLTSARRLCKRAYTLRPKDPRVAWDYACVLEESGHEREAIKIFRWLLSRRPEQLISVSDDRDRRWARSLLNDCRLMIGFCYFELHRSGLAEKWLRDYLRHLSSHTPSSYKRGIATRTLESIANSRTIDHLMDEGKWARAKSLIRRELKKRTDDFYWLANLAFIYHEEGDYDSALATIRKAHELAPGEPLVMYYYALILRSLHRPAEAIDLLRRTIRKGERRIGTVETKEGIRWARSLINDCRYEIAASFVAMKNFESADRSLKLYMRGRKQGIPSCYEAEEVAVLRRELAGSHA
jgi:Flp pilus assembly protein TadD